MSFNAMRNDGRNDGRAGSNARGRPGSRAG